MRFGFIIFFTIGTQELATPNQIGAFLLQISVCNLTFHDYSKNLPQNDDQNNFLSGFHSVLSCLAF